MPVRLVVEAGPFPGVSGAALARRARRMLAAVQLRQAELSLLLTDDDQIKNLNRDYRKNNRPTDVLAFAQREGRPGGRQDLLGDVVLSVPTAERQATERGWDVMSELTMLLAHGLLHLLGWDHDTPATERRMRRETDRLCAAATKPVAAETRRRASTAPTKKAPPRRQ
ncbi:MAG: rRNA maturation RNase YbeY [Polyangiaceae bacterium]